MSPTMRARGPRRFDPTGWPSRCHPAGLLDANLPMCSHAASGTAAADLANTTAEGDALCEAATQICERYIILKSARGTTWLGCATARPAIRRFAGNVKRRMGGLGAGAT